MSILFVLIGSCKKEINDSSKEKLDPDHLKEIHSYQNGNKLSTINFAEFKSKANLKSLGALKDIFLSPTAGKGKLMSVNIPETYNGFAIQTDSIKVLNTNGHTSYIFPVKLSSPRAVTFQNLTIDESETGTLVFVNTYTPTQKWIADWKLGKAGKFEGDISVSYLNSGANNPLNNISNVSSGGKIANANIPNKVALVDANGCSTTTYTFELAYNCGSGNHGPGDTRCILTGDAAAGIAIISFDVTTCIGGAGVGGGGGNTTTNPPNNYDPCAGGGGTPSVSYNGAKGAKLMVHQNPDCGGTTLPPVLDPVDPPAPPKEINNNLTDPCLKTTITEALATNKDVKGFLADLINKYAGLNNGIVINLSNGNIPLPAQTTPSFQTNGTFKADVVFQNGYYNDVSKEAVVAALIHEVVHAYLYQTNNTYKNQPKTAQHNFLFTNFVHDIGTYLINKYNMPYEDAYGLAWSGMGDIYNNANSNDTFVTSPAIPATSNSPAIPAKTMTKTELGGKVAPYKHTDTGSKGTPNCP